MFVRFDDVDVGGVFSIDGYIDARAHDPATVAGFILERLATLPSTDSARDASPAGRGLTVPPATPPSDTARARSMLTVTLDPNDVNCVDQSRGSHSFAARVLKKDAGQLEEVSLVLLALFVDGVQRARNAGLRFALAGPKVPAYSTRLSPNVPVYFQLLHDKERADRQDEGLANWQLSA